VGKLISASQYLHYAGWFFESKLGIKKPLVNTMIIGYECDLRCKHCTIAANADNIPGPRSMTFDFAVGKMKDYYKKGARILFFEGGEPTLWKDGDKDLRDLIKAGKSIGYFVTGYTTHGTNVIMEESDVISVSLDGTREIHDSIRGPGVFDMLMAGLEKTTHPNVFANMVVMKPNLDNVRACVEFVGTNKRIKGIMLNFITPPPYELVPTAVEKKAVVELAMKLKKEGYPILNTDRALKELLDEDYSAKCPYWVSWFVLPDGSEYTGCPMKGTESCKKCGFDAVREYRLITRGNVETITGMSKRFALTKQE
jgi:MoaA/NifB/PqqE/SkfB family radical SAM enzyme